MNRLAFLDTLRGLAALYVVLYHLVLLPEPHLQVPDWIAPFLLNGGSGVTLFFVISGFTMCLTTDGRMNEKNAALKFYIRRAFRIFPLYFIWLLVMILFFVGPAASLRQWKDIILYSTFTYSFVPGRQEGLVSASWTLGIEVVFYFLFPFIARYVFNFKRALFFLAISLLISLVHYYFVKDVPDYKVTRTLFYQMPVFALGMAAFYVYKMNIKIRWEPWLLLILFLPYLLNFRAFYFPYLMAVVYTGLLLGMPPGGSRFLGLISYSLYLNHPQLVHALSPVYQRIYGWGMPVPASYLVCAVVTLAPLLLVSYMTYRLIETRGMEWGKQLIIRLFHAKPVQSPALVDQPLPS